MDKQGFSPSLLAQTGPPVCVERAGKRQGGSPRVRLLTSKTQKRSLHLLRSRRALLFHAYHKYVAGYSLRKVTSSAVPTLGLGSPPTPMSAPTKTENELLEERGKKSVTIFRGHILIPFASFPTIPESTNPHYHAEVGC